MKHGAALGRARKLVANAIVADVAVALAPYSGKDGLAFPQESHVLLAIA